MQNTKTSLLFIIDRSGSMASIAGDMQGGMATFIEKQKTEPGECDISYIRFDDQYEEVYLFQDLKTAPPIKISPRGCTALYDSVCKAIDSFGRQLDKMDEAIRPAKVLVFIVTDGVENASKEFKLDDLKKRIEHQTSKYKWDFTFLGANIDAYEVGGSIGVSSSSTMNYSTDSKSINGLFAAVSNKSSFLRSAANNGDNSVTYTFSQSEIDSANNK